MSLPRMQTPSYTPAKRPRRTSADLARANDWGPGTVLVGDDGVDEQRVEIVGVGPRLVIARDVTGVRLLDLRYRRWRRVA